MKQNLVALTTGFLFALGLGLSGMTDPHKVIGFLDVFGHWDPSLMFVMIGAIGVHAVTYQLIRKRSSPLFSHIWHVPKKSALSVRLAVGSIIFGIGWGLAGYCPGPSLVSAAAAEPTAIIFVLGMIAGMLGFRALLSH